MNSPDCTTRQSRLQQWAAAELQVDAAAELPLVMVSGDASFRRYFRATVGDKSLIAVDAPPQHEDSAAFVKVSQLLREAGVHAPEVFAVDLEQGFMLLEDLGDIMLLPVLQQCQVDEDLEQASQLYQAIIDILIKIQLSNADDIDVDSGAGIVVNSKKALGPYDKGELRREMELFTDWFCEAFLGLELTPLERSLIDQAMTFLEDAALSQTSVLVHRDYHSRNLMLLGQQQRPQDADIGVIDFQDAVQGPYSYDLVSLLRDCYIRWQPEQVQGWARYYLRTAQSRGLLPGLTEAAMFRDFDLMGLQRHLKVMGIFCRLYLRDNKSQYLADIPLVIQYFMEVSSRYPQLGEFVEWFQRRVVPLAKEKLPKKQAL